MSRGSASRERVSRGSASRERESRERESGREVRVERVEKEC